MPAAESVHVALQIQSMSAETHEEQSTLFGELNPGCLACLMDTDGDPSPCFPEGSARPPLFHNTRTMQPGKSNHLTQ